MAVHAPTGGGRFTSLPPSVGRLLLAFASVAAVGLGLAGLELLARRAEPDYLVRARGLHVFSSVYGWAGRPWAVAATGGGRVSLNRRGYRGRELPSAKRADRTRVVLLGDSIAFGYGVADDETFAYRLDARDNGIEVANLGVQGYGPGQELLVLRHEGLAQQPDVVVLAFCLRNDFADAVLPVALYDGITPRPRFRLVGDRLLLDDSAVRLSAARLAVQWLSDHSHLFNRVAVPAPPVENAPAARDWRYRKQQALRDDETAFRVTLALVNEMERACRLRGIGFLVATFPNGLGYEAKPELAARLHRTLAAQGTRVVDMGARFEALGLTPAALALDRTGHLGPRGHAVSSEILEREVADRFPRAPVSAASTRR